MYNCSRATNYPDSPIFPIIASLEVVLGIIGTLLPLLHFIVLRRVSIYHTHVLYILRWASFSAFVTNFCITMYGMYNLAIVFNRALIPMNKLMCFAYLLPYLTSGKSFLLLVGLMVIERYSAAQKHDFDDNHQIKVWVKCAAFATILVSILSRISDIYEIVYTATDPQVCYCSNFYLSTNQTTATIVNLVFFLLSVLFIIGGTILCRMYRKEYNSFNQLSSSHNLQKRYQTMVDIRTMQVLLWILIPTFLLAIFTTLIFQFKGQVSQWLGENMIYSQNITYVSTVVETVILSILFDLTAPPVKRQMLALIGVKETEQTASNNTTTLVNVVYSRGPKKAAEDLLNDWLETEKRIGRWSQQEVKRIVYLRKSKTINCTNIVWCFQRLNV